MYEGISILAGLIVIAYLIGRKGKSALKKQVAELKEEVKQYKIPQDKLKKVTEELATTQEILSGAKKEEELVLCGYTPPDYQYETSGEYADELLNSKSRQKDMIKDKSAVNYQDWTIVGATKAKGKQMTNHMIALVLRAFNGESAAAIAKVKWNNYDASVKRIEAAFKAINKLGTVTQITISHKYKQEILWELQLVHEMEELKQEEKEEQKAIREQIREEEKAQKEAEKAIREAEKETAQWEKALAKARMEAGHDMSKELSEKIDELKAKLEMATDKKIRATSLAELTRRGHVYIISNIGSFGENIYKVGMTRRFDPLDRVTELRGASVPS